MALYAPPHHDTVRDRILRMAPDRPVSGQPSAPDSTDSNVADGLPAGTETILHASCVALEDRAMLILGATGSGKSTLALEMIALGAVLVSDDRTIVRRDGHRLIASPPEPIAGRIEARHVGLLKLPYCNAAKVSLAITLDNTETHRLPPHRDMVLLGQTVTLLYCPPERHAANALLHCLLQRRETP